MALTLRSREGERVPDRRDAPTGLGKAPGPAEAPDTADTGTPAPSVLTALLDDRPQSQGPSTLDVIARPPRREGHFYLTQTATLGWNGSVVTGYGYAVEKAPTTKGWSYPVYEELWNYGFPQEMHHFARCARGKETPIATGEDGRIVQEVLLAGYRSAKMGAKVRLPFRPTGIQRPIDLWLGATGDAHS